jgi:branched-chain amino acid transport system permease protein
MLRAEGRHGAALDPLVSFQTVIMALVGGTTSVAGPVLGAAFIGLASELLPLQFRYVYMPALGLILIAVVLFLPEGLAAGLRRLREHRRTVAS